MSDQLPENFQNLQISDVPINEEQREPSDAHAEPPKKKRIPMTLALPTRNRRILQFYGFPVNREWLKIYGKTKMKPKFHRFADDLCMVAYAIQVFSYYSGINNLMYEYVHNPGDAPPDCVTPGNEVMIVSVCRSDREGFRTRPPQENVDCLEKILGRGPPRWWEDADAYLRH